MLALVLCTALTAVPANAPMNGTITEHARLSARVPGMAMLAEPRPETQDSMANPNSTSSTDSNQQEMD